ncbi:hypothetical protein J6590_004077 [Homalodisca vitripennis]|nr:hypothetical protein J6590_004077 [Homalodisca vitripennis]
MASVTLTSLTDFRLPSFTPSVIRPERLTLLHSEGSISLRQRPPSGLRCSESCSFSTCFLKLNSPKVLLRNLKMSEVPRAKSFQRASIRR